MSSLRSRRQPRSEGPSTSSRRQRRHKSIDREKEDKEPLSKRGLACIFVIVCLVGGIREYIRIQDRSSSSRRNPLHYWHSNKNKNQHANSNPGASVPSSSRSRRTTLSPEQDANLHVDPSDGTRYHVIFSTDCSPYQHWQSYLVYYSAMVVRQPGLVTRIASGCSDEEAKQMQEWFDAEIRVMSSRFHLHFTPHFSQLTNQDGEEVANYKFFNKPFGLKHWMEHFEHLDLAKDENDIVVLIDPDMVLMRPLTRDFSNETEVVIGARRKKHVLGTRVQHGLPFAQTYGLGTQWQQFDLDKIAGADSPAKTVDHATGALYYPVGPPYLATVRDMYQISIKWTEYAPKVHAQYPHLLAEMYAFCIAAAHLGLRHQLVDSLMISNSAVGGEGWPLLNRIPAKQICEYARLPQRAVPSVLHMCQRYCVGEEWFFGKRKIPHDLYACEGPLLAEPPSNLGILYDFRRPPNQKEPTPLSPQRAAREAFMVCYLISLVNDAATYSKQQNCPLGTANLEKSLKISDLFHQGRG